MKLLFVISTAVAQTTILSPDPTTMPTPAPSMLPTPCDTMPTEIRTYQSRMNATFFPPDRPAPPGGEIFVVNYVIEGTFLPQSWATLRVVSYFEPFCFSVCDPTCPTYITSMEHAENCVEI